VGRGSEGAVSVVGTWPALTVSTGLMSPASSGRRPPSAVITCAVRLSEMCQRDGTESSTRRESVARHTFSANATRPSGSGPPTLNKPLAPASTRRFVASAKSRLYVGVPICAGRGQGDSGEERKGE